MEHHKLEPSARCCPKCGGEYGAAGSEDSEVLEIAVRAHRRVIKRQRYHCSCGCAGVPRVVTAPAPSRLIPKGILGVSIWVQVLLDKYRFHRPTYRLLEDLSTHGLELAQGTITDGLKRLAPLFAPLREALIGRNRLDDHWHADETGWYVFEATDQEAGQRWCLWVFWCREAVVFTLDRTRSARVPKEHFAGVAGGIVSVDRYSAYKRLAKDTPLELSYCWAHVRRDFIRVAEKWDEHREWGEQWLELIGELYHLNAVRLLVCNDPVEWGCGRRGAARGGNSDGAAVGARVGAAAAASGTQESAYQSAQPLVRADPVRRPAGYPDGQQSGRTRVAWAGGGAQELLRLGGDLER